MFCQVRQVPYIYTSISFLNDHDNYHLMINLCQSGLEETNQFSNIGAYLYFLSACCVQVILFDQLGSRNIKGTVQRDGSGRK
jgi:hypothetical protein